MSFPLLSESAGHLTEDLLEEYLFGRVGEPELARLEEHLFVCLSCQNKLEELDTCIALIKYGTSAWERDQKLSGAKLLPWPRMSFGRGAFLGAALAVGLACAVVLGGRTFSHHQPAAPSTVKLMAMRGGASDGLAQAPAGRPLELTLDSNTLTPQAGYRLEIVNQEGREIWSGVPVAAGATLSALITKSPRPGVYWIRLYSAGGELLREFGMRVE